MPKLTMEQAQLFILIFLRVSTMIALMPVLGDRAVPVRVKGGLSILIAALLYPSVHVDPRAIGFDLVTLIFKMASEIMIGAMIAFSVRLIFAGIQLAGELVGFQMGFSVANVIDPSNNEQVSIIAEFQYLIAILLFLGLNGHHIFLSGIADSFKLVPLPGFQIGRASCRERV